MPTKEQLSEEVNEILGTEIDWSGLKKDELELLYELLDDGDLLEPQAKHIIKKKGKDKLDDQIDEWQPGQIAMRIVGGV